MPASSDARSSAARLYRRLLRVFPADFRAAYETDLVDAFLDAREARVGPDAGAGARFAFWWRTVRDVVGSGLAERWARLRGRSGPVPPRRPGSGVGPPSWGTRFELAAQELRVALRSLRRRPGFAAAVVLILGVSVAAATTLWGTVYHVAVAPLGFEEEEDLVAVWYRVRRTDADADFALSDGLIASLAERSRTLRSVTGVMMISTSAVLEGNGAPAERVSAARALPGFFETLGVRPTLGRTFREGDGEGGVVILSHEAWRGRYGGDPGILGRTVRLDGQPREVIGVLSEGFLWPGLGTGGPPEFWRTTPLVPTRYSPFYFRGVARLRPGATPVEAQREAHGIFAATDILTDVDPARRPERLASVRPLRDDLLATDGPQLRVLAGALGLVLLLGTANVAVLMLIRTVGRARESVLRVALGGGATRAAAPVLAELLLLLAAGAVVALGLSAVAIHAVRTRAAVDLPRLESVSLSLPVLAGGLAVALASTLAVAAVVGLALRRWGGRAVLQAMADPVTGGRLPGAVRAPLLIAQTALSVVLLGGALLFGRSFLELSRVETGFVAADVLQGSLRLPTEPLWEPVEGIEHVDGRPVGGPGGDLLRVTPAMSRLREALRARLTAHPAVTGVSLAKFAPLSGDYGAFTPFRPEWFDGGEGEMPGGRRWITGNAVAPDFLPFLGVDLVRGRWLTARDDAGAPRVALISETLARSMWPEGDALGSRFTSWSLVPDGEGGARTETGWTTVVGVVRPLREWDIRQADESVYTPLVQAYAPGALVSRSARGPKLRVFVRYADGAADAVAEHMRAVVADLLPGTPLDDLRSMETVVASQLREPRFFVGIFGVFGAIALVLAVGGIAAVVGYGVSRRTGEIGLRMALGARPGGVLRMVASETLWLVGLGIVVGLGAAWAGARVLEALLYDVRAGDPWTLAAAAGIFAAAALVAAWLPARRAAAVDPARTLRYE